MRRDEMTEEAYETLITAIARILLGTGPKAMTMGSVAKALKMSKKTLYEIFPSKSDMVEQTMNAIHGRMIDANRKIFMTSGNIMEAMFNAFLNQRDFMRMTNVNFFRDMDRHFAEAKRKSEAKKACYYEEFVNLLKKGVTQGVFRNDINYMVQCRMMAIQMESLKRMEELFPPDITLLEVYDSINIGFLRGIATPKGMKMLDSLMERLKSAPSRQNMNVTTTIPTYNA